MFRKEKIGNYGREIQIKPVCQAQMTTRVDTQET